MAARIIQVLSCSEQTFSTALVPLSLCHCLLVWMIQMWRGDYEKNTCVWVGGWLCACALTMGRIRGMNSLNWVLKRFIDIVYVRGYLGYPKADAGSISESSSDIIELNEAEYTKKLGNANPKPRNSSAPRIETDVWPYGKSLYFFFLSIHKIMSLRNVYGYVFSQFITLMMTSAHNGR